LVFPLIDAVDFRGVELGFCGLELYCEVCVDGLEGLYARKAARSSILGVFALLFFRFCGGALMLLRAHFLLVLGLAGKTIAGEELVGDVEAMVSLRKRVIVVQRLRGCVSML
jgi:hypothetical protein